MEQQGVVFDVTGNKSYSPGGAYHGLSSPDGLGVVSKLIIPCFAIVFAGKDASRALAKSSVKAEDAVPKWSDLSDKEKGVLNDWYTKLSRSPNSNFKSIVILINGRPGAFYELGSLSSANATTLLGRFLVLPTSRPYR